MTAIAGIIGGENGERLVQKMLDRMEHRGPDTERIDLFENGCAGVRALEISEIRGDGYAADEGITVFFDGEIYNPRPAGTSDAELVLGLYKEHGRAFGAYLEGVFACALMDGRELVLARDSVGVRPLYWGTAGEDVCFSSEMKALTGVCSNVQELLPSTTFSSEHGVSGYISRIPEVHVPEKWQDAARALYDCVMKAVERRLNDGAVGACLLSGGLDSSILAAAVHELGADMPLMTVGHEADAPDVENAKIVAEHLGMEHEIRLFSAEEIEQIVPRAVYHMESFDEDCVSGTVSNLFASKMAASVTNSILSGEGGDELFGGYHLLKDVPTQSARLVMMQRLIDVAYNTAVQRLDRAMTANGIDYRTPFIDSHVMAFAAHLPVDWKIHECDNGEMIEKWLLREAFKELLPEEIYSRSKLRFAGGAGTDGVMDGIAAAHVDASDLNEQTRETAEGYTLNSPKELWYYRLFKGRFPDPCFERLVGRWDPDK